MRRLGGVAILLLFATILTLLAYGQSINAGFMFDAPLDLPRATDRGLIAILTGAGASIYYRPIVLVIWHFCYLLLGRNDGVVLHGILLGIHVCNGFLVYQLGRRLVDRIGGLVASALFLLYPLSFQVVGIVDSTFHALVTLWLLAATTVYWDARTASGKQPLRLVLAAAFAELAMFTHETGLAVIPLAIALEVLLWRRRLVPRLGGWPALFAAPAAIYLFVWSVVPRYATGWHWDPASLIANGIYFLQGLASPVTSHLASQPRFTSSDQLVVLAVAIPAMAVLAVILLLRGRGAALWLGFLWFALTAFPSWAILTWYNYVVDAPRLLYLPAVGISLLWAAALAPGDASLRKLRNRPARALLPAIPTAIGLAATGAILLDSFNFISLRETMQSKAAAVVTQLVDTATRPDPQAGIIYVNLPSFLAVKSSSYLLGHTGITLMPDYFGLDLDVYAVKHVQPPLISLGYNDVAHEWDYFYGFHGRTVALPELAAAIHGGGGVYLTDYLPTGMQLKYVGQVEHTAPTTDTFVARYGNWAVLESAVTTRTANQLMVDLTWRALGPAPGDYTAFLHVTNGSSKPLVQDDGYPIGTMFPFRQWQAGDVVRDRRYIALPTGTGAAQLTLLIGLYDRANPNVRAPAVSPDGQNLSDSAASIIVR